MTGRKACELNGAERTQVLDAVRGLLIAERETGIAPKELIRIIASHRQSRARLDRKADEWLVARASRQSVPGRMTFTTLRTRD